METSLDALKSNGVSYAGLDEVGYGFALPQHRLEFNARFGFDAAPAASWHLAWSSLA